MEKLAFDCHLRNNIAQRLRENADSFPNRAGLIYNTKKFKYAYKQKTFRQLDEESDIYAYKLKNIGICQGTKTILMVKPGVELFRIVFALFKIGAIPVIVDPDMGIKRMLHCYKTIQATAFIGIPLAHLIRILNPKIFVSLKALVNIGKPFFYKTHNLSRLNLEKTKKIYPHKFPLATVNADDLMIINFTTGSTGPAKGVEYTHKMANEILCRIVDLYQSNQPMISLATFPIFGILDLLIGSTSVLPIMNPTKPAKVNPEIILRTIHEFKISHMFASPAFLNRISEYGKKNLEKLSSLKCVISGGAPVSKSIVEGTHAILPQNAHFHITYGSTEALPISSIRSTEWLDEVKSLSASGKGTCVGKAVSGLNICIIRILDTSIFESLDSLSLPIGEIGEIVINGSLVSPRYADNKLQNELMKITENGEIWHRTGDLGYLDSQGRVWFVGRKSERIITSTFKYYTEQVEGIFNAHPNVFRSALVCVENKNNQVPIICIELHKRRAKLSKKHIESELLSIANTNPMTNNINTFLFHPSFPVDIRHNAKINRKKLAHWAQYKINIKSHLKWLMSVPIAGWIFLIFGVIYPINNLVFEIFWWIVLFLSVVVHTIQMLISLPLAQKAGISFFKSFLFTILFGAAWWGLFKPQNSLSKLLLKKD